MKLIVTRPQHDLTTRYISSWAQEVIDLANKKRVDVIDLQKEKANKNELVGRIKKVSPSIVFLNGHGTDSSIKGHDDETLVHEGENEEVLFGRITYSLSCSSAKMLGSRVARNRNTAFIGYSDDFIFSIDKDSLLRPEADSRAKPFKESSNQIMVSLLKGHTAGEAVERSKKLFLEHHASLVASTTDQDSLMTMQCLWWNMKHQVCLGDESLKG